MRMLLFLLAFVATSAHAATGAERLQRFHSEITGLSAEFSQTLRDPERKILQVSAGHMDLQKPGLFRWEYNKPYPQMIIGDGKKIWIYDPELEQVTVKDESKAIGSAPALVLSGGAGLEQNFTIENETRGDAFTWIKLIPRQADTDFKEIHIAFSDDMLVMLELQDMLGQTTEIEFRDLIKNPDFKPGHFQFVVPKGVEVVGDTLR